VCSVISQQWHAAVKLFANKIFQFTTGGAS